MGDAHAGRAEEVSGQITQIEYTSETGWHILQVKPDGARAFRACGALARPVVGARVTLTGRWGGTGGPGRAFLIQATTGQTPAEGANPSGLINHLIETLGITTAEAGQIVAHFGPNTLAVLDQSVARIREVPGLSPKVQEVVAARWPRIQIAEQLRRQFAQQGLSVSVLHRLASILSADPGPALAVHPYLPYLYFPERVNFNAIEAYAQAQNLPADALARIEAGIIRVLHQHALQGQTYLERSIAIARVARALQLNGTRVQAELDAALEGLVGRGLVQVVGSRLHLQSLYLAETRLVDRLRLLARATPELPLDVSAPRLSRLLAEGVGLTPSTAEVGQLAAALSAPLCSLIGLPSQHAQRLIVALTQLVTLLQGTIFVCAPTRASAARLAPLLPAGTAAASIAEWIGLDPDLPARHHAEATLACEVLLVVDADRLTVVDAQRLLDAVAEGTRVILLGDLMRLPPVGPGQPLRDLVACGAFAHVPLGDAWADPPARALRTAMAQWCARAPAPATRFTDDALQYLVIKPADVGAVISAFCREVAPALRVPLRDVLLVTPMRKPQTGIPSLADLNTLAQAAHHPHAKRHSIPGAGDFSAEDPIILRRPYPDEDLAAGERGTVVRMLESERVVRVSFGDSTLELPYSALRDIALGYAVTAHLAAGLASRVSVVVLLAAHGRLLNRQLLLSAIGSASERCVVFAEPEAIAAALKEAPEETRDVYLPELLRTVKK